MLVFKFHANKGNWSKYMIATILGIGVCLFLFSDIDILPEQGYVYLLIAVISSLSMFRMVNRAKFEFEEVMIMQSSAKFYFFNKMKDPITLDYADFEIALDDHSLIVKKSNSFIGKAVKSKMSRTGMF